MPFDDTILPVQLSLKLPNTFIREVYAIATTVGILIIRADF